MKKIILGLVAFVAMAASAAATRYSMAECSGSLMPYTAPERCFVVPDSLKPVLINHVGRHGARYPAGPSFTQSLETALKKAEALGTITPEGSKLLSLVEYVMAVSKDRWGALDSVGMAEQSGIAMRMYHNFPELFNNTSIVASSSYTPRCVMSMDVFTHQLDELNNHIEITSTSGRQNSPMLRPFDVNKAYLAWRKTDAWKRPYDAYIARIIPDAPLKRVLGENFPLGKDWRDMALNEYYVLAGMAAMGCDVDASEYFTPEEYNAMWSCFNLRQYLQRTATSLSTVPAEITTPLLADIITTTQAATERGYNGPTAILRFGHAETLMPLLSQIHLGGCYYVTNDFNTVSEHWKDFDVVPMAANLQFVLLESNAGRYYLLTMHNERPVTLLSGDKRIIVPWEDAKAFLRRIGR